MVFITKKARKRAERASKEKKLKNQEQKHKCINQHEHLGNFLHSFTWLLVGSCKRDSCSGLGSYDGPFYPLGDKESWKCFKHGCDDFKSPPGQQDKAILKPHVQIPPPNRNVNWCSHCGKLYEGVSKN